VTSVRNYLLTPLGVGDLIDRAVRLYRRNFFALVKIAAAPVIVSAVGGVLVTIGWRGFYTAGKEVSFLLYTMMLAAGLFLQIGGNLSTLMVMGGATRNFVRYLLWGEPVSARETFRSVKSRFWSLLGAAVLIGFLLTVFTLLCL
jgi:hypothetical protein